MGSANVGGGGGEAAVVMMMGRGSGSGGISGGSVERTVDGQACAASAPDAGCLLSPGECGV